MLSASSSSCGCPLPLRWELYPIPKGPRERQRYGGSYFEQSDWWTKSSDTGRRGELAFMAKEVLPAAIGVGELSRAMAMVVAFALGTLLVFAGDGARGRRSRITGQAVSRLLHLAVLYGFPLACSLGVAGSLGLLMHAQCCTLACGRYTTRSSHLQPDCCWERSLPLACCRLSDGAWLGQPGPGPAAFSSISRPLRQDRASSTWHWLPSSWPTSPSLT